MAIDITAQYRHIVVLYMGLYAICSKTFQGGVPSWCIENESSLLSQRKTAEQLCTTCMVWNNSACDCDLVRIL